MQCYEAVTDNAIDRLLVLAFGIGGIDWDSLPPPAQEQSEAGEYLRMAAEHTKLKYNLVVGLLAGMERHIRESAELSEDIRGGILEAVKTEQARFALNATFDL